VTDAVKALHSAFELGADAIRPEDGTGTDRTSTVAG
jgi:hypothetical protein